MFLNSRENFENAKTAPIAAANAKRRLAAPLYASRADENIIYKIPASVPEFNIIRVCFKTALIS